MSAIATHQSNRAAGRGRRRTVALTLFVGALLLAGCGGDGAPAAEAPSDEAVVADTTPDGSETVTTPGASSISTTTSTSIEPPTTEVEPPTTEVATTSSTEPDGSTPEPTTTTVAAGSDTTSVPFDGALGGAVTDAEQLVKLRFESRIDDVSTDQLAETALAILNDERGWPRAGFRFERDDASPFVVVLAEGSTVDELCLPLQTFRRVSCQNGPVVALNADRWRSAVPHWDAEVADYRGYLINHEVGHLLGQRHPKPRCPVAGRPAGVMEQQTAGLEGCVGNAWPRDWEVEHALARPVVYAPLPDWGPDPVPANGEG